MTSSREERDKSRGRSAKAIRERKAARKKCAHAREVVTHSLDLEVYFRRGREILREEIFKYTRPFVERREARVTAALRWENESLLILPFTARGQIGLELFSFVPR